MTDSIVTRYQTFGRVELPENAYEKLLSDLSPRIFPDALWFEFKAPISSIHGVAHPDALIAAKDASDWWVVEVELARHSVRDHVELQLTKLRDGWYTAAAMNYIKSRYPGEAALVDQLDLKSPRFMLLLDEASGPVERVARQLDFEVLHVLPFCAGDQFNAVTVQGAYTSRKRARITGVTLSIAPSAGAVRFSLVREDDQMPPLSTHVMIGSRLVKLFRSRDGRSFVAALSHSELVGTLGVTEQFVLLSEANEPLRIMSMSTSGGA